MSEDKTTRVCPSCGAAPWDFGGEFEGWDRKRESQPAFCKDCGDKLVPRSELARDIWKDPNVKAALKEGRPASDIYALPCPECNHLGYYNEGSSFSCRFGCGSWRVTSEQAAEAITLADSVTETRDGYHNETQ